MMIHEKIMSGQFLLDRKNDRSSMLHSSHHHLAHHSQHHQPPSPPMPAMKMDLYSAYAYQQQLQQHLIGSSNAHHKSAFSAPTEVLDLSRRCDSVETPRKTPSPYQTNTSFSTNSPSVSPAGSQAIPTNLLYSAQAQQHQQQQPHAGITLPSAIASLYPAFYYPGNVKQEPTSASSPPLPPTESRKEFAPVAASNLLQTFASAAAAATVSSMHVDVAEPHSPDTSNNRFGSSHQQYSHKPHVTTPTSSTAAAAALASTDVKTTRPFKAFPRDPLVIAANFAATDVLLDNPRVERYTEYRKRVLEQIRNSNGGSRTITNPKMRRTNSRSGSFNDGSSNNNSENEERNAAEESSDCDSNAGNFEKMTTSTSSTGSNADLNGSSMHQTKDAAYYERRRKNNAAAKKSRDRRRIKEDEIAIRAAYLERQNIELLCQIDGLKAQLAAFTSKVGA